MSDMETLETGLIVAGESAITATQRAEIDMRIVTAKSYPRQISRCLDNVMSLVKIDAETAEDAYYSLPPRAGSNKPIQGPSVRLAEIMANQWKNFEYGATPLEIGDKSVTAQGFAWDLENNVKHVVNVTRRITNRNGARYGDDMIQVTMQAACSIALRNAVLRVIPRAFADQIVKQCMSIAAGNEKSLSENITSAVAYAKKIGVDKATLFRYLGVSDERDVTIEKLAHLRGIFTAIKDGVLNMKETFYPPEETPSSLDKATKALKAKKQAPHPAKEPPFEPEPPTSAGEDNEALMETVARLSEHMDAASFDKICDKVAKGTAPQFMDAAQLELLVQHLQKAQAK